MDQILANEVYRFLHIRDILNLCLINKYVQSNICWKTLVAREFPMVKKSPKEYFNEGKNNNTNIQYKYLYKFLHEKCLPNVISTFDYVAFHGLYPEVAYSTIQLELNEKIHLTCGEDHNFVVYMKYWPHGKYFNCNNDIIHIDEEKSYVKFESEQNFRYVYNIVGDADLVLDNIIDGYGLGEIVDDITGIIKKYHRSDTTHYVDEIVIKVVGGLKIIHIGYL